MLSMLPALAVPAAAAPNPSGGHPALWDEESLPPLFGAAPSDDVCAVFGCFFGDEAFDDGAQEVYFPAVGNADQSTGLGAAQTSITVQNLSVNDAYLFIYVGTPEDDDGVDLDNWEVVEYAYLSGGASKTFQASDLEIPAGEVRPVVVAGYNQVVPGDGGIYLEPVPLAGVAKQAVTGNSLPFTTAADLAVSGYNAIGGRELGFFDQLYFPIVQTNCGPGGCWNSMLRIANMGLDDNAAVTVRFFPADDGSGSLQTGFQLQDTVDVGETWSIDLSEWVPAGWVGSAHVYTDDAVGAVVDRVKPGTDMWITNTASNATSESIWQVGGDGFPYVLFAPDVRTDYNGWNTGINVANTVEADTDVSIQYFGSNGNAPAAQTRRLAPHGMTYFYNPSDPTDDRCEQPATDVPGCEFIGGAVILSTNPVAVAVDGVKYFGDGNDANVGQAFSYAATGNAYDNLQAPLVQKGNPADGMGATSGINVMNPNADATIVEATWLNPSGFAAANFGSSVVWVPGYSTGFVYTMFHNNLPNGYYGSAVVTSTLPVVATTANVDYQVQGDGTAIWNLSNPCGFFRQAGDCVYTSPLEPGAVNATLTQQVNVVNRFVTDANGEPTVTPLPGVLVSYAGTDASGAAFSGSGLTGSDGSVTFAVPEGNYTTTLINVPDAPEGYVYDYSPSISGIFVPANSNRYVVNNVQLQVAEGTGTLTKEIINTGEYTSLESEVYFCPQVNDPDDVYDTCVETALVTAGYGEADMADHEVTADLPAGAYTICTSVAAWYDSDNNAMRGPFEVLRTEGCESAYENAAGEIVPILVFDTQTTTVVNDFDTQAFSILNVYVRDDVIDVPVPNAEVCFYAVVDGVEELVDCRFSDGDGNISPYVPGGTYRITAQADGFEQEATITVFSPAADAADGGLLDLGEDADVVISLDPAVQAVVTTLITLNDIPAEGVTISVQRRVGNACIEPVLDFGQTSSAGLFSTTVSAGDYCVTSSSGDSSVGITFITIDASNTDVPIDVVRDLADPISFLNVAVTQDGAPRSDQRVYVHASSPDDSSTTCAGTLLVGIESDGIGAVQFSMQPGTYCVVATDPDSIQGTIAIQAVVVPQDTSDDVDGTLAFTSS